MKLKPCPFCGGQSVKLNYHESKYYGQNDLGAKKIKFTGYIVCNKCLSRGKPVSVVSDRVNCMGWTKELIDKMFPLAAEAWNKREPIDRIVDQLEEKLKEPRYQHDGEDYYVGIIDAIEIVKSGGAKWVD